jgi:predicted ATPase
LTIPFVSRELELNRLREFLRAALAGRGSVCWVTGEPGSGKTSLVEEFCRRSMAERGDLVVAAGSGNAHTGSGDPYHVFRELLGFLSGDVEARWAAGSLPSAHAKRLWNLLPVMASALTSVGPDLIGTLVPGRDLLERVSSFAPTDAPWKLGLQELVSSSEEGPGAVRTQLALFNQCSRVLRAVARERPLVLVLDDLQRF